ncbi:AAA family ATPase [Streptomyces sp. NPDC017868]|uniref:AAA family ATPase n=1 Tax=Streptomyces sp. NPDC017868 TaxID=3365014 RepID=UPI0037AFEE78
MKRYGHGLVPGRFHPPHAGHHHLVRTARDRCERLTVLVRASAGDTLPLEDRVAWMREIHPDVLVVGGERYAGPERVDAVFVLEPYGGFTPESYGDFAPDPYGDFAPESYGDELGRRLGAATVHVDRVHPFTDTAVREDPAAFWDFLEPPVRAALTRRVVLLGAESTGTTTMARALTDHYRRRGGVWARTRCVPAYEDEPGAPGPALRSADFPVIAQRQAEREEEAARDGSPVLFCDTDAFAATIRHELHFGTASPAVGEIAARGRQHLWLLTDHRGIDRADDPDRLRPWMTARLLTQLAHTGRRTAVLTGPHEERLAAAVAAVDALLAEGMHLTEPQPERR